MTPNDTSEAVERQAREMLAEEWDREGRPGAAHLVGGKDEGALMSAPAIRAIIRALTPTPTTGEGRVQEACKASPDHADILETIENASDSWQKDGYPTALAEVRDMANVGRSLVQRVHEVVTSNGVMRGWMPADDPAEIVIDMANRLDDLASTPTPTSDNRFQSPALLDFAGDMSDEMLADHAADCGCTLCRADAYVDAGLVSPTSEESAEPREEDEHPDWQVHERLASEVAYGLGIEGGVADYWTMRAAVVQAIQATLSVSTSPTIAEAVAKERYARLAVSFAAPAEVPQSDYDRACHDIAEAIRNTNDGEG